MEDSIVIPIKIDASGMEEGAKKAESSMKGVSKRANEVKREIGDSEGGGTTVKFSLGGTLKNMFSGFGNKAKMAAAHLKTMIPRSFQKQISGISNTMRKMGASIKGIGQSAKSLGAQIVGAASVYGIISKAISTYMSQNQQLSKQVGAIWTALGNLIGPIIEAIVGWITHLVSLILSFLRLIGITTKTASELSKKANSAGGSLQATIAGFDELNKLQSGGGGGGAGRLTDYDPTEMMEGLAEAIASGDFFKAGQIIADKFGEISEKVGNFFEDLDNKHYGQKFADFINGIFSNPENYEKAGAAVGKGLNLIIHFFEDLFDPEKGIDFHQLGVSLMSGLQEMVDTIDWDALSNVLSGGINGLIDLLTGAFNTFDPVDTAFKIAKWLNDTFNRIKWEDLGKLFANGVNRILFFIQTFLRTFDPIALAKNIMSMINTTISNINWKSLGASFALLLFDALEFAFTLASNFDFYSFAMGLVDMLFQALANLLGDEASIEKLGKSILGALFSATVQPLEVWITSIASPILKILEAIGTVPKGTFDSFKRGLDDLNKTVRDWASETKSNVDDASKSWDHFSENARSASGHVGKFGEEQSGVAEKTEGATFKLGEQRAELEAIRDATTQVGEAYDKTATYSEVFNTAMLNNDAGVQQSVENFVEMGNAAVTAGEEGSSAFELYSDPLKAAGIAANSTEEDINKTSEATTALADSLTQVKNTTEELGTTSEKSYGAINEGIEKVKNNSSLLISALDGITNAANRVVSALQDVVSRLEGVFSMQWKLPKLILPHLQVQWESQDWMQLFFGVSAMPHLSVQWYKRGGIIDGARLIGAGEDGKEAIVPLERNTEWIDMVAKGLIDRLQDMKISSPVSLLNDIASTTQFKMPVVASGVVAPYSVSTAVGYNSSVAGGTASSDVFADLYNAIRSLDDSLNNMQWIAQFDDVRAIVRRITKEQRRNTISEGR